MSLSNEEFTIGNKQYLVIACSVMGQGKIENQDSLRVYSDLSQLVVVVADGLGSAAFSKEGSSVAAEVTCKLLADLHDYEELPDKVLRTWKERLSGKPDLYDTTIKFMKITETEVLYGGIGDGWIAMYGPNKYISLVAENSFSNQTDSILSYNLGKRFIMNTARLEDIETCLIATDGFSEDMDKDHGKELLQDVKAQIIENAQLFAEDLQATMNDWPVETNRDDKTVVIVQKKETLL